MPRAHMMSRMKKIASIRSPLVQLDVARNRQRCFIARKSLSSALTSIPAGVLPGTPAIEVQQIRSALAKLLRAAADAVQRAPAAPADSATQLTAAGGCKQQSDAGPDANAHQQPGDRRTCAYL